jgi:hypothetical protein
MPNATFLDVIKANAANANGIGMIDEVSRRTPFFSKAGWRSIKGTSFKTLVNTGASNTLGSFRKFNAGIASAQAYFENRTVDTVPIQPQFVVDAQIADASEDGAAAFMARHISGILETEFIAHEVQLFYGAASGLANAAGYPGLLDAYDPINMVNNAGGTTANTGSSVWFVQFGPQSVQGVIANGGQFAFGPLMKQLVTAPDGSGNMMLAYVQVLTAQVGLQVANILRVARLKNLTADVGATLTDKLIMDTITMFKQTGPNAILMNRRSIGQLRDSRTATNPTGNEAPFPTSVVGLDGGDIPIWVSEGLSTTEPLTL